MTTPRRVAAPHPALVLLAVVVVTASACARTSPDSDAAPAPTSAAPVPPSSTPAPTVAQPSGDCPGGGGQAVAPARQSSPSEALDLGGGLEGRAATYPHPQDPEALWSQWGQGGLGPDGTFYSAIGNELGRTGNSLLYRYAQPDGPLELVADMRTALGSGAAGWGPGKIHSQMVPGPCGELYFTTYWGDSKEAATDPEYPGEHLFRLDPATGALTDLGIPVPGRGVPSLASWPGGGLVYGEAADPSAPGSRGSFFAYDVRRQEVVFSEEVAPHVGFRSILVGPDGAAYFSAGEGRLHRYDPPSASVSLADLELPGQWLRAATAPAPDGTVFGVTREPDTLFALRPSGEVEDLGPTRGYVASLGLDPGGRYLYYVPDAHGKAWRQGTPVVRVDTASGAQDVVVELLDPIGTRLGVRAGGSYDVVMDPGGRRLFVGLNAGSLDGGITFGTVVLAVVDLPA